MPEGDTIHRTAMVLRPVLEGQSIVEARGDGRAPWAATVQGQQVTAVEARGKHLLIALADGRTVHAHSGMTGSWHVYPRGAPWQKPARQAAIVLSTAAAEVVFFNPKQLELLAPHELRRHAQLSQLGPDLLGVCLGIDEVLQRFRACNALPLGVAVMDQRIVCGIGNIYKSEMLFVTRLDPFAPVAAATDSELATLIAAARGQLQHNLDGGPRTIRRSGDGSRLWVYGRQGKPCYRCGAAICLRRQGTLGRTTYWCPDCQPPRAGSTQPQPDA